MNPHRQQLVYMFSSIEEAALWEITGECNYKRMESGVKPMMGFYHGDGTYGDGKPFHWDYYNSFVMQPMLLDIVQVCAKKRDPLGAEYPFLLERARRYAVIRRMIEAPGTFDEKGWLQAGVVGYQPASRESYICTGSLYLCLSGLLHLGLPSSAPFWNEPATPLSQQRIWA